MRITGDWLNTPQTQAVFATLQAGGHRALAVGGCVRNALFGAPVSDIDIATDAVPGRVSALAEAAGLRAVPTGIDHGTVTVISGGVPHEVTTFRRDVETDGRRAVVAFSADVAEDARRRDFTMNALYAKADGTVIDPLGGLPDLEARHVRFIGSAEDRIREDYLRILRFFRFTAWYGAPEVGLDEEGLAASAALQEGLEGLSRERVSAELRKILSAPDPAPAIASMAQSGILARLVPGAEPTALPILVAQGGIDWRLRLAALGGDVSGLRLSSADLKSVERLGEAARDGAEPFALGDDLGEDGEAVVRLRAALLGQSPRPQDLAEARLGADAVFPLKAADFMPSLSGPALGTALAAARADWRAAKGAIAPDILRERHSSPKNG